MKSGRETDHFGHRNNLSTDLPWKESRPGFFPLIVRSPGDRTACIGGRVTNPQPACLNTCISRWDRFCQWRISGDTWQLV